MERKRLMADARRNFISVVWVNEARDLHRSVRQVEQEGPPLSHPTLFLLSNGKGTPLAGDVWRACGQHYLSALRTFDLPHDLYRCRPRELADTIHRFLLGHL